MPAGLGFKKILVALDRSLGAEVIVESVNFSVET